MTNPSSTLLEDIFPYWLLLGSFPQVLVVDDDRPSDTENSSKAGVDECLNFLHGGDSRSPCL